MRAAKIFAGAVVIVVLNVMSVPPLAQVGHDSKPWRILAGSVETIDEDTHTLGLSTRSGSELTRLNSGDSASFDLKTFRLRAIPDAVSLKLSIRDSPKVWVLKGSHLESGTLDNLRAGQPVLIELQSGRLLDLQRRKTQRERTPCHEYGAAPSLHRRVMPKGELQRQKRL